MTSAKPEWNVYARNTMNPIIQAHYYFTVWRNYRLLLQGLKIPRGTLLEFGSSTGQISLRLSRMYKLSPTLVDTSALALTMASRFYRKKGIIPILIKRNILELKLGQKYDFVHSHGLLEHFVGKKQQSALEIHISHVKQGGWVICWIPTPDIFYRINSWYLKQTGKWIFGFEQPLTLKDVLTIFRTEKLIIRKIRHFPGWIGVAAQRK
jgi:cyclopropane fatty-acyl-phospholipid synthase-like methyltransferase